MDTPKDLYKQLLAVNLTVSTVGGRKKLFPTDLGINTSEEDKNVLSLGSKKIIDPDVVRPFLQYKHRAINVLATNGLRFSRLFLVPLDTYNSEVEQQLALLSDDYYKYKKWFLVNYLDLIQDWARRNPKWEESILKNLPSPRYIDEHLHFSFEPFSIQPATTALSKKNENKNKFSLREQFLEEISQEAADSMRGFIDGGRLTRRTLNPLKRICEKAQKLAFVSPDTEIFFEYLKKTVNRLEGSDEFSRQDILQLVGVIQILINPTAIEMVSAALKDGDNIFDDTGKLSQISSQAIKAEESKAQAFLSPASVF